MAGAVATSIMEVIHDIDPKKVIWDAIKPWINDIDPTSGDVVIAVYQRPEKTKGGLLIPETASRRAEDAFQGVVGMIVKTGPDYGKHKRALALEKMPAIGDWVAFKTVDCVAFTLGKSPMRLLQGDMIRMVLRSPDCII